MDAKMLALKSGGVKWVPIMSSEEFTDGAEAYVGFCDVCGESASHYKRRHQSFEPHGYRGNFNEVLRSCQKGVCLWGT